jgi:hypothetical protein
MPQFNPEFWVPQLFWLAVVSVALFLVLWRITLPRVDVVFADRQERIGGNLQKAETLKAEAEAALAAYQKSIADAPGRRPGGACQSGFRDRRGDRQARGRVRQAPQRPRKRRRRATSPPRVRRRWRR